MGVISASGLIYRDFLQYILPTIVGVSLFVPLLTKPGTSLDIENLILLAFVGGYVIFTPIATLAEKVQGWLSPNRAQVRKLRQTRIWWAKNWDYDQLWAALDKDEREYLYATASYIHFFRISSLYLLIYTLANLILIGQALGARATPADLRSVLSSIWQVQTSMLGNWQAPSWIMTLVALALCLYQHSNALVEFEILFGAEGFYVKFSEKYQRKNGGIASGVWGWLQPQDSKLPLSGVKLLLLDETGSKVATAVSGGDGEFQFEQIFKAFLGKTFTVQVEDHNWSGQAQLKLGENSVPSVRLFANPNPVKSPAASA